MRVEPCGCSDAAGRSVANPGSQPFARGWLKATPWYADPASDVPDQNAASPPASTTMVGMLEPCGGSPRRPGRRRCRGGGARWLDGGALPDPLWFVLDLTVHPQVQDGKLVRRIMHTAECDGLPGQ